ncbi:zinc transport system permease protein [Desulfonatronum thiosulfatophilum]|uniref:Zinc transport system permease protein n=1 Tax=Desulfonatronum thiosulfatophilum TaxID=617002 RepID=A0A1G6CUW2_9BACT|nr:metal ABC transporter permease [Desulfonatronum thiosulfatophilum]SDB36650.1 zinc transport system permease protein [Desulfonatronum thiosulfatophilum]
MSLDFLQFEFMRNALLACLLISISCGIMGTLVVVNRLVFLSGGIAHASYGGVGAAMYLGSSPYFGAALFALLASGIMGVVSLKSKHRSDTVIGVIWAVGMAVGIILVDITPGYNVDLMSYLFGSILLVPRESLWLMAGLNLAVLAWIWFFYSDMLAMSYDEEYAQVMGAPVRLLYFALLALTALTVVVVIQAVGLILVIALLTIPAVIAEGFSRSLGTMMAWSVFFSATFCIFGLLLAYHLNLTAGASIVMVAAAAFFLVKTLQWVRGRRIP